MVSMKGLIVDNGTKYRSSLERLFCGAEYKVISYQEVTLDEAEKYDFIVLSGGHDFPVVGNENRLVGEIELAKRCTKPVLGICFGFEIMAYAYGAELKRIEAKTVGRIKLEIMQSDPLFDGLPNLEVFENHRWVVSVVGDELIALAKSNDGVEVIKHKTKNIYGVQFHPEMLIEKTCGDDMVRNFIKMAG